VGDGPEIKRLKKKSAKNIEFLGEIDDAQSRNIYARCRAFLFAADEDFGLVPLEAQSHGRPVIALGKGGALETVVGSYGPVRIQASREESATTGIFFPEQTADSLAEAILAFESCEDTFEPKHIRLHARRFDTSIFINRMHNYISSVMAESSQRHIV
jgi:glycosyltransferase involved in cell wall biosynthesis